MALAAGLVGCGGGSISPPPPPPPPPPADNTRNVAAHAGDGQRAKAGEPVAVAPAIRVTNRSAAPVAGVEVVFSIGAGNGTLAGSTATTGADGVAAAGGWTLGAVGANTPIATVTGATAGSPVTFAATGEEILVLPSKDTTLSGVIRVTRFIVPAGIKITVKDSPRIVADGAVEIAGSLEGDCTPVTIDAKDDLTVKGILDNGCADPTAAGPKLVVIGRGGYRFEDATIGSSGDVEITDDPTLVDADFEASPSPAPSEAAAATAASHRGCTYRRSQYPRRQSPARDGNNAPTAGDGRDGTLFKLDCRGNMLFDGAVRVRGQDGGNGGNATAAPAVGFAKASGGKGGNGGNGGSAAATAGVPLSGVAAAPASEARGGAGGAPGLFTLRAKVSVKFIDPTKLIIGDAGNGGNALALGRNGNGAIGAVENAQIGGAADAFGGAGGGWPRSPAASEAPASATVVSPTSRSGAAATVGGAGRCGARHGRGREPESGRLSAPRSR